MRWALIGLAALLAWETSGWDAVVAHMFGNAGGFAWKHAAWLTLPFHDGLRLLAGALLAHWVWRAWRPRGLARADAAWCAAAIALCMVGVALLKAGSSTSCPWDLALYGGPGGVGRCFPSGHATVGFAFFAAGFAWRRQNPQRARAWFALAWTLGLLAGATQVLRGAHFVSHVGWTAWLCWTASALLDAARTGWPVADRPASPSA